MISFADAMGARATRVRSDGPPRLLLVGPPGAGKSTQGARLAAALEVPHLSTGALLRDEVRRGSPVGRQAGEFMRAGDLVPDWLLLFVLEHRLSTALDTGVVLDGYPRTLEQAERFLRSLGRAPLERVIELAVDDETAIGRVTGRANGARGDDDEQTARARLAVYRVQTKPMLDFFRAKGLLETVDGNRCEETVAADLGALVRARSGVG